VGGLEELELDGGSRRPVPSMLLNRYATAWLGACAMAGAGAVFGYVRWPIFLAVASPLLLPSTRRLLWTMHPRSLSDRQLAHAWWRSSLASQARMPVESRLALVSHRQTVLDEMLRRGDSPWRGTRWVNPLRRPR
jgi:hypothetical protein